MSTLAYWRSGDDLWALIFGIVKKPPVSLVEPIFSRTDRPWFASGGAPHSAAALCKRGQSIRTKDILGTKESAMRRLGVDLVVDDSHQRMGTAIMCGHDDIDDAHHCRRCWVQ